MLFAQNDRAAISLFLTDIQHQKDVRRNFAALTDSHTETDMLQLVEKLGKAGILNRDDSRYLTHRITKLYAK